MRLITVGTTAAAGGAAIGGCAPEMRFAFGNQDSTDQADSGYISAFFFTVSSKMKLSGLSWYRHNTTAGGMLAGVYVGETGNLADMTRLDDFAEDTDTTAGEHRFNPTADTYLEPGKTYAIVTMCSAKIARQFNTGFGNLPYNKMDDYDNDIITLLQNTNSFNTVSTHTYYPGMYATRTYGDGLPATLDIPAMNWYAIAGWRDKTPATCLELNDG